VEFDKTANVAAPAERVWQMLLDPEVMAACVPGMESIEVLSETQYLVNIHVRLSFVSARFKMRTTIVEARPPSYLRSEGAGEDSALASSLKQSSEVFLSGLENGASELRMKLKIELFGRLGGLGFNVIRTKADRMWEEFGRNLAVRVAGSH
jgi:uncharacterized protein